MLVSLQNLRCISALSSSSSHSSSSTTHHFRTAPFRISCRFPSVSVSQTSTTASTDADGDDKYTMIAAASDDSGFDGGGGGSGIHVPRQSFISVSKSRLLDAIISTMFSSQEPEEARQFLYLSQCLDSILHAEHKSILEEMRADYDLTLSTKGKGFGLNDFPPKGAHAYINSSLKSGRIDKEQEEDVDSNIPMSFALNLKQLLDSSLKRNSIKGSSDVIPARFQRAFMKLLYSAEFEELSHQDLMLTSALNTDYILTLPIYIDWKKASESNAIIFRRGYATEIQKGLLIGEKFDYLQSKLLQNFFVLIAKNLGRFGVWLNEVFERISQKKDTEVLANKVNIWLKEFSLSLQPNSRDQIFDDHKGVDSISNDLPIWEAAQKAATRYEAILSAGGPREKLLRKFFALLGLVPSKPMQTFGLDSKSSCESHLSESFLPRITLSDIWKPAKLKNCGNDFWKMLRTSASILISESVLQEPAFQQIILLYMEEVADRESTNKAEVSSLQMKIYEEIPLPDLPVVFPHKKLSFRILDSVRLDAATILGLLAYFLSYKFEDILSSPSALLLDVIAASALVIYVTRALLGYKQTRERYHLLVNRTLYEKTAASGFGCIHFLLDASEQQQFKEAILVYAILLNMEGGQVTGIRAVGDKCERFIYNVSQEKVKMPVEKSIDTLVRLGLVTKKTVDGQITVQAVPCSRAHTILQKRWSSLIGYID